MAIIITGGAGYIGSHTAKFLARQGLEPVVVDDLSTGHRASVRWGPFVQCDIADQDALARAFDHYAVDAVMHLGASCSAGDSMAQPSQYFRNNVSKTLVLLDTMLQAGVKKIVFSSTCAIYGSPAGVPIAESAPQIPVNPYGESKRFVERALKWYSDAYGLAWVALRYFNAAGADPEGELGEQHDPETHLIPQAILAALGQAPELKIYGSDHPTSDGSAIRDYVHVADLASTNFQALEYLRAGGASVALNLGSGQGHSVLEVVRAVEASTGRNVPAQVVARRAGDPPVLLADTRRAKEILGWTPQHSTFENIIATAHRWHASRVFAAEVGQDVPA
jgi:UDP-arabinose 4-epimerase